MTFRYYSTNRPPGYATVPDGYTAIESTLKKDYVTPQCDILYSFGWVEYESELTFAQIFSFELLPSDRKTRARYLIWRNEGRTETCVDEWLEYCTEVFGNCDPEQRKELCEYNPSFEWAYTALTGEKK